MGDISDAEHIEQDIEDCSVVFDDNGSAGMVAVGSTTRSSSRCGNLAIRVIFSTPGLVVLVIVYSVMGALIFPLLEARHGHGNGGHGGGGGTSGLTMSISKSREDCLRELWTITERLNVLYERNWTMLVHEQLRRFEGSIVAATKGRLGGELIGSSSSVTDSQYISSWSFKEALLYSVTVITTIGHGNMTPRTAEGKLVTIVYALFGVPLMLMCLSSLGGLLAEALQCAYCRVCRRPDGQRDDKIALTNGCALTTTTPMNSSLKKQQNNSGSSSRNGNSRDGKNSIRSFDELNCDGNNCKYDYVPTAGGGLGHGSGNQNNNMNSTAVPYHQAGTVKPQVDEGGNIYTGSPKHVNLVPYQSVTYNNSYSLPHPHTQHHPLQSQLMYHPPNLLMDTGTGTMFHGTPTKKYILAEMPIEYGQLNSSSNQQHHHQQLQDAVTNVSPAMLYQQQQQTTHLHNNSLSNNTANGLMSNNGNCVILINSNNTSHPGYNSMASPPGLLGKNKFMPKPLPQEINLLIAESAEIDCQQQQQQQHFSKSLNYTPGTMLDDEEDEDNRSYQPHGTPSRVPLIKRSSGHNSPLKVSFSDTCKKSDDMLVDYGRSLNRNDQANGDGEDYDERTAMDGEPMTQVPMMLIFVILIGYISLGTVIFAVWEDWSVIDGAYFCFVTLSTIGFGDLVPWRTFRGPELQLFACFLYLLLGLVLVAMTFTVVENQLMWKCRRVAVRLKLSKP